MWDFYEDLLQLKKIYENLSYIKACSVNDGNNRALLSNQHSAVISKMAAGISFQQKAESQISRFKMIIEGILKYNGIDTIISV